MEFAGVVGFDGLMGASSEGGSGGGGGGLFSSTPPSSEPEHSRQRGLFGSGNLKHGRTACCPDEHGDWRSLKMARCDQPMLTAQPKPSSSSFLRSNPYSLFSDGEQMLSFSTSRPAETMLLPTEGLLPYYHYPSPYSPAATSYARSSGMGTGSSSASMHGVLGGVKGPFTPSQWMELEHQALIYKYIDANMPIPSSLLLSIRRGLNHPSGYSVYSAGSFRQNPLGCGTFNLGFSGSVDPEPGRCRRTDGKKWRCARDAVSDQKYCERHMNRGRHRSRKHVEGQNGHAAKAMPIIAPSQAASAVSGGRSNKSLSITQHQMKCLQNDMDRTSVQHSRMLLTKENTNDRGLSMVTAVNSKATNTLFPVSKQHNTFEGTSSVADFGLFSSDSLNHHSENIIFDRQPQSNSLRHFINDLPKDQSDHSTITWPEVEDMQSERTQLSISIPVASSDFSSSSSSPNHEKPTLSPLRLSRELDPIHMGLGVGVMNEVNQRQTNWIPISWEGSLGGPLGEVLVSTNNTPKDSSKNCSSSLNLLTDGWDSNPHIRSSPTDVLQKTTFCSVSGSTGSSPRAENHKAHNSTSSLCEDLLGSTLVHPSTIPSL